MPLKTDRKLSLRMRGADVAELQAKLRLLGAVIKDSRGYFGKSTREAVIDLQDRHALRPTGVVTRSVTGKIDELVNALPESPGTEPREWQFLVRGEVRYRDGLPIPGVKVRAFDKELRTEKLLGSTTSNAEGIYEIWYGEEQLSRPDKDSADLLVRAYSRPRGSRKETVIAESEIMFSAQMVEKARLWVDGGPEGTWSEYEQLMQEIEPLLAGAEISELAEDEQQKDITLLSGKLAQSPQRVATLVVAHKLAARTGGPPEVFYALFRENLPTNLYELLAQSRQSLTRALKAAVNKHTIPGRFAKDLKSVVEDFAAKAADYTASDTDDTGRSSLNSLLALAISNSRTRSRFLKKYLEHKGKIGDFWASLNETPEFRRIKADAQITLQLGALTGNHLPLVKHLLGLKQNGKFKTFGDLAAYGTKQWQDIINSLDVPQDQRHPKSIPGKTAKKKTEVYAATLERILDDTIPTSRIAHRIQKDASQTSDVRRFFSNLTKQAAPFDLKATNLDQFLSDNQFILTGIRNRSAMRMDVLKLQRVAKLTTHYDGMMGLVKSGLDSSLAIAALDRRSFVNTHKMILGGEMKAQLVYQKASHIAATALNLFASYSPSFNAIGMRVFKRPDEQGIPDIETLFGSLDLCSCNHCQSVYSPSAYLAELLAFLNERQQTKTLPGGAEVATTAKDVLFERRPDLGNIELTCENTDTVLPYIDLVNEVLENRIAPFQPFSISGGYRTQLNNRTISTSLRQAFSQKGIDFGDDCSVVLVEPSKHWLLTDRTRLAVINRSGSSSALQVTALGNQTSGSSAERSVSPQHTNPVAYDRLRAAVFPWSLPFDLWWQEADTYLGQMKLKRFELMSDFCSSDPAAALSDVAIAGEYLKLPSIERQIITGGALVNHATVGDEGGALTLSGLGTLDGVRVHDGNLVLVKDHTDPAMNGVYIAREGAWKRYPFLGQGPAFIRILSGSRNRRSTWLLNTGSGGITTAEKTEIWNFWNMERVGNLVTVYNPTSGRDIKRRLSWVTALRHVRLFLEGSELTYADLLGLLRTSFVNPDSSLHIVSADPEDLTTCDTAKLIIENLDANALVRAHRFVRLWRKLGWSMRDLDRAISAFSSDAASGVERLNDRLMVQLAHVQRVRTDLNLTVEQSLTFWSDLNTDGSNPLYERLFLNPSVIQPVDPDFELDGEELAIVSSDPGRAKISLHASTVMAATGITSTELALLTASGPEADVLNLANLSRIHRYALLAEGVGISLREVLSFKKLSGLDPFDPDHPENLLRFTRLIDRIKDSGFSIAGLDYVLAHRFAEGTGVAPDDKTIALVLDEIRGGMHKIWNETAVKPDPAGDETAKRLSSLRWHPDQVSQVIDTLSGRMSYQTELSSLPGGLVWPAGLASRISHDTDQGLLMIDGPLTTAERTALRGLSGSAVYRQAVERLYQAPRDCVANRMKSFEYPDFSEPLAALPAGLEFPAALRDRVHYDHTAARLCFRGMMADSERTILLALSADTDYQSAVGKLYDAPLAYSPAPDKVYLTSTDAAGMFDTAQTAEQRFAVALEKASTYLRNTSSRGLVVRKLAEALELEAKSVELLLCEQIKALAVPGQYAIEDFLAKGFAESSPNMSVSAAAFPALFQDYIRLYKASRIINTLKIDNAQLTWLAGYLPDAGRRQVPWIYDRTLRVGWLDWSDLPVEEPAGDEPVLFGAWLRLLEICRLRDQVPLGEQTLDEVFGLARGTYPDRTAHAEVLAAALERSTGWDADEVLYLIGENGLGLRVPDDFKDEFGLAWLMRCFRRIKALGTCAAQCQAWAASSLTQQDARSIQQAVKAGYPEESWAGIAKPLRDSIRNMQRAALVSYLVHRPDDDRDETWQDSAGLYGHFLIDVEMDSQMETSRIKQAISSVQLFIQRCLMNLEGERGVVADEQADPGWGQWKWMKNYRVWEANRKVFLYPENWIEPDLRDDKTACFKSLESRLLQSEVTQASAEDAFRSYLHDLGDIARLEVAGMYRQAAGSGQPETLHVFGRTQGVPPVHYYRQRTGQRWTPWERLDLDISEAQLIPVLWNRRLYLFWPIFTEKTITPDTSAEAPTAPQKYFELGLAWSERREGKWLPRKMTAKTIRSSIPVREELNDHNKGQHVFRAAVSGSSLKIWYEHDDPGSEIRVSYPYGGGTRRVRSALVKGFHFTGCDTKVKVFTKTINGIFEPSGTVPLGMTFAERGSSPLRLPKARYSKQDSIVLSSTPGGRFNLLYPYQDHYINAAHPFFFQDDTKTFCVEPKQVRVLRHLWAVSEAVDPVAVDMIHNLYYTARFAAGFIDPLPITLALEAEGKQTFPQDDAPGPAEVSEAKTKVLAKGDRSMLSIREFLDDARLLDKKKVVPASKRELRYDFNVFYHPFTCDFTKTLERYGVDGLFRRGVQLRYQEFFPLRYKPTNAVLRSSGEPNDEYPLDEVDFSHLGAYAPYNWELFFHAPLLIAARLSQNQRFEEAQQWFHYIFDPTDASDKVAPRKFWRTRPFYEHSQADYLKQRIDKLIAMLAKGEQDPELTQQIEEWRRNPFKPHSVASMRPVAYQKTVVMKYLDNLLDWGDHLFRQDTMESINEATQLYILAAEILGPRPRTIAPRAKPQVHTSNSLAPSLAAFSNRLVDIEYMVGAPSPDSLVLSTDSPPMFVPKLLYFCIPRNDQLLGYWDTVADRLYKIRHSMNIEGVVRKLRLFEPPIDPALLVKAAAAGIDISTALTDMNAPLPHYRFNILNRKATEICAQVKALGAALLSGLTQKDAEELARLKAGHETTILGLAEGVFKKRVEETAAETAALKQSREVAVARYLHFQKLLGVKSPKTPSQGQAVADHTASAHSAIKDEQGIKMIEFERQELAKLSEANDGHETAGWLEFAASIAHVIPNFSIVTAPWGAGTSFSLGGSNLGSALSAIAGVYRTLAAEASYEGDRASRLGRLVMREHDWSLQSNLAAKEIMQIDKQLVAAEIREELAKLELANQRKQQEHAKQTEAFLRDKYTDQELYNWMTGQISSLYFQAYRLAYDVAKQAERAYRFELGLDESDFIRFGYWDSLKKGLLAGERLEQDIQRMETAYLDQNRREYELSKHVSLALLSPEALVSLRQTGTCYVELPEALFDLDCPGHYMRRLKSVSLSIPCVTGPYTVVSCKLTMLSNRTRKTAQSAPQYACSGSEDPRFNYSSGGVESIVTSTAREDSGMFQLDFNDLRYLPFEGAGAISAWRIELPASFPQFDYNTISDVILHLSFTAREGGELLKQAAVGQLRDALNNLKRARGHSGLLRLFSARHEFPEAWHGFMHPLVDSTAPHSLSFKLTQAAFPAYLREEAISINQMIVFVRPAPEIAYSQADPLVLEVTPPGAVTAETLSLTMVEGELGGLPAGAVSFSPAIELSADQSWKIEVSGIPAAMRTETEAGGATVQRLATDRVLDVGVLCLYSF
ncbi:MAG: peptidoglycan-binding protein [Deltaproteobacteria bacterium]|nr:peptidoglycan-binding protein [Deltaproteobacteria bacterium]